MRLDVWYLIDIDYYESMACDKLHILRVNSQVCLAESVPTSRQTAAVDLT
jgi:hypothetical protein